MNFLNLTKLNNNYGFYSPGFGANPNSSALKFVPKDFYVNIKGYGKNEKWADVIIKTADMGASLIRRGTSAENVLKIITCGVIKANKLDFSITKMENTGILRVNRADWKSQLTDAFTCFTHNRYESYADRLIATREKPLLAPNPKLAMTRPNEKYPELEHGNPLYINKSLDYVIKLYNKLFPKFTEKEIKSKDLRTVNSTIAEIRWVLAHATPWMRGSDAISNVFIRAIYKALGIKTFPLAKGISLDLEAYCTDLKDYKKNFITYFQKAPEIVD